MVSKMKIERVKKGITQIDLWMRSGIPQWRISLIERGITPKPDEAAKIAEVLSVTEEELFFIN
jgi:transcriptional regulator with XRE-family HTH domain